MNLRLTDHFTFNEFVRTTRTEFSEKNSSSATLYLGNMLKVAAELEKCRAMFKRPVFITSGYRCPELNSAVGGSPDSQHLFGSAADFVVEGYQDPTSIRFVFDWCRQHLDYRQLILELPPGRKPWIHLGVNSGMDAKREALIYDGKSYVPA